MRWILKQVGNIFGIIFVVIIVLATHRLVDFLVLSRIGLADVPLLGSVITIALLVSLGWVLEKRFPDDEDEN